MKNIYIDCIFSTISVFIVLMLFPLLFGIDIFKPFIQTLEDISITDFSYSVIRDQASVQADTNLVIVDIEDLTNAGMALLISKLNEFSPEVIGIDIMLSQEEKELDNLYLADALSNVNKLVLISKVRKCKRTGAWKKLLKCDAVIKSDSMFAAFGKSGYSNLLIAKDKKHSTVRHFEPRITVNGMTENSFDVSLLKSYSVKRYLDLTDRENESEIIDYKGDYRKFHFLEGINVIEEDFDLSFIKDKIILLGIVGAFRGYELLDELYFTPMNERYVGRTFPDMTEVEIHANIISMLSEGRYSNVMPLWLSYTIAFFLCYINMIIFSYICIKNKQWYELGSLLIFLFESLAILYSTVMIFHYEHYQMRLTEALYAVAVSVFAYQIYNDTLKPLTLKVILKLKNILSN